MQQYIDQLNDAQRLPVLQKDGPMIVIAGAGSGKTRVLTIRIAYLMHQGIDAFNILALTFTNKAAREMKERIAKIVGISEARNLWMGTFHSIFARILRAEADKLGYPSNFSIYDVQDCERLIGQIIKDMQLDKEVYKPKQILNRISSYKNNLITVKAYFNNPDLMERDAIAKRPRLGDIYQEYVNRCFKAGAMDFDDLLLKTNELLTLYPDVLAKYQNRFRYILVDEYQDTNHSQYLIVKALSDKFQNICVVGDDAQSIYAFRGANINNILNFQRDYNDTKVYRLEQNYRSTKNIVEAANSIIDKNKTKLEKVVWTANESGEKIKVHRSITDTEEARFVASTIFEEAMTKQMRYSDFAILYRTNAQSRAIEDALRKKGIDYRIYGGLSFYQRKEIKDVLAYLRLVINPKDEEALIRVINYPARGIGSTTLEKLNVAANHYRRSIFEVMENIDKIDLKLTAGTQKKLADFVVMIKNFQVINQNQDAYYMADYIVKKTGLVQEMKKDSTPEGVARLDNIEGLINGIKDFVEQQKKDNTGSGTLYEFLEDVALATDIEREDDDKDRVALMTIHLAKGLEFPVVFCVGMEENLFPSALTLNSRTELEEERRLFYVALTRAEKQAYLTYAQSRYRWGNLADCEPSRFIHEIDAQYLQYLSPPDNNRRYVPNINADIFGEVDKSKFRQTKPVNGTPPQWATQKQWGNKPKHDIRRLRKVSNIIDQPNANIGEGLQQGQTIMHERFGQGIILNIEGAGADKKAEIKFDEGGVKKLLLRFAKLTVIKQP